LHSKLDDLTLVPREMQNLLESTDIAASVAVRG
jgi:hypothetical protein